MKNILLFVAMILTFSSFSQDVSNIITKQNENKIDITFEIENSKTDQLFYITIYCAIDGKEKIELKSVTGDVGDSICGGQDKYKITWDVLKDVDELNSAEFFIKIKMKNNKATVKPMQAIEEKKWVLGVNTSTKLPIGGRISYMDNWGGYFGFRIGATRSFSNTTKFHYPYLTKDDYDNGIYDDRCINTNIINNYDYYDIGISLNIGVMKRIINKNENDLFIYAGAGFGYWGTWTYDFTSKSDIWIENQNYPYRWYNSNEGTWGYYENVVSVTHSEDVLGNIDIETGLYLSLNRIYFNLGTSFSEGTTDVVLGIGYSFF